MKTIIAGGRDYQFTGWEQTWLSTLGITEVVSGCCSGADACGEAWAKSRGIPVTPFPADWEQYGRPAGPIRNEQMACYADACVLFNGGRGTRSMRGLAGKYGLRVFTPPKKLGPQ